MPDLNPKSGPDHDVIPAPEVNWSMVGAGLFSLFIFGLVAYGSPLAAIALCALAAVVIFASRKGCV